VAKQEAEENAIKASLSKSRKKYLDKYLQASDPAKIELEIRRAINALWQCDA